jgi:hypothetical protein
MYAATFSLRWMGGMRYLLTYMLACCKLTCGQSLVFIRSFSYADFNFSALIAACRCMADADVPNQIPLCTFESRSQNCNGESSFLPVNASTPSGVTSRVCSNCADRLPSTVVAVHSSGHVTALADPSQI